MPNFVKIGESLVNLEWVRAVEYAPDGRLQIFLSEDRAGGLVLRFSGDEARAAWQTLTNPASVPVISAESAPPPRPGDAAS